MSSDLIGFQRSPLPCVMMAQLQTSQTSNLAVGDHIKFDTLVVAPIDNRIRMDTTTAYTNGAGNSIGRFSLASGYLYELNCNINSWGFTATQAVVEIDFYEVLSGTRLNGTTILYVPTLPYNNGGSGICNILYSPPSSNLIEVRIVVDGGPTLTRLGFSSGSDFVYPTLLVKCLGPV